MRGTCASPHHTGDRLVDKRDLYERRDEYRRVTDQSRFRTRKVYDVCRACVTAELGEIPQEAML